MAGRRGLLAALGLLAWSHAAGAPRGAGPALPSEAEVSGEQEALAARRRVASIESLQRLLQRIDEASPEKAEMYFQLAELTWEESRAVHRAEMRAALASERGPEGELQADHRGSELLRAEAARLDELVLSRYPGYARRDEVLYALASSLYDAGRRDEALTRYEELLREHPRSGFVPDVHVQLGNHLFDVVGSPARARASFERALATGSPRIQAYALYRLAWCDLNQGQPAEALRKLQETVARAERQGAERAAVDLRTEALRDSVRLFVELQRPDEARAWYRQHATPERAAALLGGVGEGLLAAGHPRAALAVLRQLLADWPDSEQAPGWQRGVVRCAEGLGDGPLVLEEATALAERYRPGGTWWSANQASSGAQRAGLTLAVEALGTLAAGYHQEAERAARAEGYRLARDLSRLFLEAFAQPGAILASPAAVVAQRSALAEALWTLEEYGPAAAQYDLLVAALAAAPADDGRALREAAYAAVLAWDRVVKLERGQGAGRARRPAGRIEGARPEGAVSSQAVPRGSAGAETPLGPAERGLVTASDAYLERFAGEADAVDVAYQAALLFHQHGQVVEAARRLGQLILIHPEERRSQEAAELALRSLEERRAWPALEEQARQLLANRRLARPGSDFARRLEQVVERSHYLQIDEVVVKQERDLARAIPLLAAHAEEFPRSETASRALAYAFSLAVERGEVETALGLAERLRREHPDSLLGLRVTYQVGHLRERLGDFAGAAEAMEAFAAAWTRASAGPPPASATQRQERQALLDECTRRPDHWLQSALFDAGLWQERLGHPALAREAWTRYLARFAAEPDAPAVAERLVGLLEAEGRLAEALRAAELHLASHAADPRVTALEQVALLARALGLAESLGRLADAQRLARALAARVERLGPADRATAPARRAAAHARFAALEPDFRRLQALALGSGPRFRDALAAKRRRLEVLEAGYTAVVAEGDAAYALAALTRIGALSADLAARIAEAPPPPGLDEDQLALFRDELSTRLVLPLEARAAEALDRAVAKAFELGLYGPWLSEAQDQLQRLRPGAFPAAVAWSPPAGRDLDAVEATARATLARQPDEPAAWLALGEAALARGELPLAGLRLERASRLREADPTLQTSLGLLASRRDQPEQALAAFLRALALAPDHLPALEGLAALALSRRDFARAAATLKRAAALAPDSGRIRLGLGLALDAQRTGDPALALPAAESLARAVELGEDPSGQATCAAGWAFAAAPGGRDRAREWLSRCAALPTTQGRDRERIEARLRLWQEASGPR